MFKRVKEAVNGAQALFQSWISKMVAFVRAHPVAAMIIASTAIAVAAFALINGFSILSATLFWISFPVEVVSLLSAAMVIIGTLVPVLPLTILGMIGLSTPFMAIVNLQIFAGVLFNLVGYSVMIGILAFIAMGATSLFNKTSRGV
jgi:hypothetical protein